MPLDQLQARIARILRSRRSRQSFAGGSSVFNETFPRSSQDIDIYVEDVEVPVIADADIGALRDAGLKVSNRTDHYGFAVEATISDGREQTQLEWSEADRARFFTIQSHPTFGWALHKADLAIQKLIAGASRREARDMVDLFLIDGRYIPLAIAAIAAPAKAPGASPIDLLERARKIAMGHPAEDIEALRLAAGSGLPGAGALKFAFADRVQAAIDAITERGWKAKPGRLYFNPRTGKAVFPTNEALASLRPLEATERGTVPFTAQAIAKGHGKGVGD